MILLHWIIHTCTSYIRTLANVNAGLNNITTYTVQPISHNIRTESPMTATDTNSCAFSKVTSKQFIYLVFTFPFHPATWSRMMYPHTVMDTIRIVLSIHVLLSERCRSVAALVVTTSATNRRERRRSSSTGAHWLQGYSGRREGQAHLAVATHTHT